MGASGECERVRARSVTAAHRRTQGRRPSSETKSRSLSASGSPDRRPRPCRRILHRPLQPCHRPFDRALVQVPIAEHQPVAAHRRAGVGGQGAHAQPELREAADVDVQRPVARVEPPKHGAPGLVICNPPYGERLGEVEALKPTYAALGDALRRGFIGWRAALITNNEDLGRATGMRADRKYVLWNGALECTLLCFNSVGAAPKPRAEPRPLSEGAIGFRNRLLKNQKHLAPKFRREDTDCWRVYDADLPDYAAAIDRYGEMEIREGTRTLTLHSIKADGRVFEPESIPEKEGLSLRGLQIGDFVEYEFMFEREELGLLPGYVDLSTFRFQSPDTPFQTLMVASADPREGKTSIAVSIAVILAQSGKRVLLIDTDLRRPRVHKAFGVWGEKKLYGKVSEGCIRSTFLSLTISIPAHYLLQIEISWSRALQH